MENKYYLPKIEELHIGFECEINQSEINKNFKWCEYVIGTDYETITIARDVSEVNKNGIRVKYLDRQDIESFGFICAGIGEYQKLDDNTDDFIIVDTNFVDDLNVRICYEKSTGENVSTEYTMFDGAIKNKSEFKKLLIQLNIINE